MLAGIGGLPLAAAAGAPGSAGWTADPARAPGRGTATLLRGAAQRVAHCPLSSMRLASGIAPLPALHRHGVRAGLGHDGGTNDTSDMFHVMKAAVGLQRARHEDAGIHPTIPAVLRMATLAGAECIGMADRIGSLTPGKRADVVVLDPGTLNFAPRFGWTSQIVLNGQPPNVSEVFVDGRLRKERGELVQVDTARVVREAERAAANLRAAA